LGKAFKVYSEIRNKKELRISQRDGHLYGLIDGKIVLQGDDQTGLLNRLRDEADKADPKYFGFDGARNRFLHFFKAGFHSPNFVKAEREYKLDAKRQLDIEAPLERAITTSGLGEAVLSTFRDTNLLHPLEKARLPKSDAFIRGAAKFASGDAAVSLAEMEKSLNPHRVANWKATTYLPFLWRPDAHMFLPPEDKGLRGARRPFIRA
jgi:hypothetical protein